MGLQSAVPANLLRVKEAGGGFWARISTSANIIVLVVVVAAAFAFVVAVLFVTCHRRCYFRARSLGDGSLSDVSAPRAVFKAQE